MKYVKIHEYSDIMKKIVMRCPGIEPGSTAWKAAMLTTIPTSLDDANGKKIYWNSNFWV